MDLLNIKIDSLSKFLNQSSFECILPYFTKRFVEDFLVVLLWCLNLDNGNDYISKPENQCFRRIDKNNKLIALVSIGENNNCENKFIDYLSKFDDNIYGIFVLTNMITIYRNCKEVENIVLHSNLNELDINNISSIIGSKRFIQPLEIIKNENLLQEKINLVGIFPYQTDIRYVEDLTITLLYQFGLDNENDCLAIPATFSDKYGLYQCFRRIDKGEKLIALVDVSSEKLSDENILTCLSKVENDVYGILIVTNIITIYKNNKIVEKLIVAKDVNKIRNIFEKISNKIF